MFKNQKIIKFLAFLFCFNIFLSISQANETIPIDNIPINETPRPISSAIFEDFSCKEINLKDYNGKLVIINFWATWCAPCKEEMPHLNRLKSKDEFKDVEIIPINIADEEYRKSKEFFEDLNINNLEIFYGSSLDLAKEFKLRGIPTTIFIDKEGFEFARVIGFIDFENKAFLDWLINHL